MAQALYRKWRPRLWDEVVAQEAVVQTLRNAVRTGRISHAYLLSGPRGTGKTTTARLLAKALNCLEEDPAKRPCDQCEHCQAINEGHFLDLIEIDAASNTSVDDVRSLREKINFSPSQGQYKVYIIDEVHMLSTAAFNALLKTLEEPPPHAIFILATTEVHKIPATVLSRVQRHEFRRIPVADIVKFLRAKAEDEGLEVDEDALTLIARQATGAMRDAISLLDQLSSTGRRVTLAEAQEVLGTATSALVLDLVEAILARDPGRGLEVIQSGLDAGTDARQFARQVVDYLRNLLLVRMGSAKSIEATPELRAQMVKHAGQFDQVHLLEAIKLFNAAATDARSAWHPGLALELALAETIEMEVPAAGQSQPAAERPQPAAGQSQLAAERPQPAAERPQPAAERSQPAAERSQPAEKPQGAAARPEVKAPSPNESVPPGSVPPEPDFPDMDEYLAEAPAAGQKPANSSGSKPAQTEKTVSGGGMKPPAVGAAARSAGQSQASPVQTPPASPPVNTAGRTVTLADVQQQWTRIRQMVQKENKLTGAALNSCVSRSLKDNVLILGFQTEVVKSKMETNENLDLLRKTIQAILGVNLGVRCVVVGPKGSQQQPDGLDGDGMVNAALGLGGKIMHEE